MIFSKLTIKHVSLLNSHDIHPHFLMIIAANTFTAGESVKTLFTDVTS